MDCSVELFCNFVSKEYWVLTDGNCLKSGDVVSLEDVIERRVISSELYDSFDRDDITEYEKLLMFYNLVEMVQSAKELSEFRKEFPYPFKVS